MRLSKRMYSVCPKCGDCFSTPDHLPIILPACLHHLCSTCVIDLRKSGPGKVICYVNECAASTKIEEEKFLSPDFYLLGYLSVHGDRNLRQEGSADDAVHFFSETNYTNDMFCVICSKMSQMTCATCKTGFCSVECFDKQHRTPLLTTHHHIPHEFVQNICQEHGECFRYVSVDDLKLGCPECTTSGELRTKKVVRFDRVMEQLKISENLNQMVDISKSVMCNMLTTDNHLSSELQTLSSLHLENTRRLETHIEKCHRILQIVEVMAINDMKKVKEVREQALLDKRKRVGEVISKLLQLIDDMESEFDDVNVREDQETNLVLTMCEIEKSAEDHINYIKDEEFEVNIDTSILSSIADHISIQKIHDDPILKESKSAARMTLHESLSEMVKILWEKEKGNEGRDETVKHDFTGRVNVILMHVESPESFYLMMTKNLQLADSLRDLIQKEWDEGQKGNVTVGDLAVFKDDHTAFHRVHIISLEADSAWLHFIDRGNYSEASLSSLVKLSVNVCKIPPLAYQCCLAGVESKHVWEEAAARGITQFFSNDVAQATVLEKQIDISKVVVSKVEDEAEISLREFLAFRELACKDVGKGVLQPPHFRTYFCNPLDTSSSVKLVKVVLVTNPCQLFVNLVGNDQSFLKYMNNLVDEMYEEYKEVDDKHAILVPYVGLVCVVKHDNRFFRAEVVEVIGDIVKVKFVDVGLEQRVHFSCLRRIQDKFLILPVMAIKVGLSGIRALQETWSGVAVEYAKEVMINKLMKMKILNIEGDHYLVEMFVEVSDSVFVSDKSVNKMIIEKGYALAVPSLEDTHEEALVERLDMIPGSKFSCRVVSARSPEYICLRRMDDEESFFKFNEKLNRCKSFASDLSRNWKEGDSCLVNIITVGWVRARLINIMSGGMAELLLYDYSDKIISTLDKLKPIPSKFSQTYPYSWIVQLPHLKPAGGQDTWTYTTCEAMLEILEDAGMVVDIELLTRGDRSVWYAELYVRHNEVNSGPLEPDSAKFMPLSKMLVDQGLALPFCHIGRDQGVVAEVGDKGLRDEAVIEGSMLSGGAQSIDSSFCWLGAKMPSQLKFVGNVSHVDWDCNFYISSLEDNLENQRIIGSVLDNKYSGSSPSQHDMQWSQGEACIAQFSIDQKWYRGQVLELRDTEFLVMFVDYGTEELCTPQNMRKGLFMKDIPVQCFTVQLEIAPITNKWEKGVLDFIHRTVIDKPLNVTVLQDSKGFPLIVRMVSQAGIDLKDLLVTNEYAREMSIKAES